MTISGKSKKVCKFGVKCFQRNPVHIQDFVHPGDDCYLAVCKSEGVEPEFVSIRKLFEWCDTTNTGKATRAEVAQIWSKLQVHADDKVPPLTDELWQLLDDDGNGHVNFSEFAELTTMFKVRLPLGLDDLFQSNQDADEQLCCGVRDCPCKNFHTMRRRCKYGETCYQDGEEHRAAFAHAGDDDWDSAGAAGGRGGDKDMCTCKHKRKLHASSRSGAGAVPFPKYWSVGEDSPEGEFQKILDVDAAMIPKFQELLKATYSDVTTRDRANHSGNGDWRVPRHFKLVGAQRNENSKLWRKYCIKQAELQKEKTLGEGMEGYKHYDVFKDVETSKAWESLDSDRLNTDINEWYLFHGTSSSAARNICSTDFKMRLAGTATGTLYGKGSYMAESITKADEYAKQEGDVFTVLLCRVLGGHVNYCDTRTPDADELTKSCTEGDFDCIIGDRKKVSGTYREFVIFDTENVYPEYILTYKRGELFKSASYPGGPG